jgi:hypothetical protein
MRPPCAIRRRQGFDEKREPAISFARSLGGGLAAVARAAVLPLDRRHRARALAEASDRLAPAVTAQTRLGPLRFRCPNAESSRIPTQFEAWEPDTLAWIDAHVGAGDCLWDVGGHVGGFALYAGLKMKDAGGLVLAFEPSAADLTP